MHITGVLCWVRCCFLTACISVKISAAFDQFTKWCIFCLFNLMSEWPDTNKEIFRQPDQSGCTCAKWKDATDKHALTQLRRIAAEYYRRNTIFLDPVLNIISPFMGAQTQRFAFHFYTEGGFQ